VRVGRKRGGTVRLAVDAPRLSAYGQRVAAMQLPLPAAPVRIDFLYGAVAAQDFPARALRRAVQAGQTRSSSTLRYIEPEGDAGLRRALQGYLARARGLVCDLEQVLVVHGSQQAIDLCARLLLDPADAFVIEDPGYLTARRSFEATGARCITVPVDEHGLLTQALPDDPRIRLAYVTPSHQFPLGGVLPIARRHELLAWAERHRAWILEDDYDGEFRYGQRPIDALQSIDHQARVVYVGTFSKALSPQLRLGYMVLPPELVRVFRQAKQLADRHAPVSDQQALAALIDSGGYERHVRRTRREHERRRAALLEAAARHLPHDAQLAGLAAGLHAVLWLPGRSPSDEPSIVAAARALGVGVYPVSPLFAQPAELSTARPAGLILGYASLTPAEVTQGLRLLGGVLQGLGEPWR
jgi:GntR family transcriptional regulator / MocR family aminotransferase